MVAQECGESRWSFPFKVPKMYGGEIMASSIAAAMELADPCFLLASFTTHFSMPLQTGQPVSLTARRTGGGRTIQYIGILAEQDANTVHTDCIFARHEDSSFAMNHGDFDRLSWDKLISYQEFSLSSISKSENISREEAAGRYGMAMRVVEYFSSILGIRVLGRDDGHGLLARISCTDRARSYHDQCTEIAYFSDFLMVQYACTVIGCPWYDLSSILINTLKQSITFCDTTPHSDYFGRFECFSFDSSRAVVRGTLCSGSGKPFCTIEQTVSVRQRKRPEWKPE